MRRISWLNLFCNNTFNLRRYQPGGWIDSNGASRLGTCCSSEETLLHLNILLASAGSSISAEYTRAHPYTPISAVI